MAKIPQYKLIPKDKLSEEDRLVIENIDPKSSVTYGVEFGALVERIVDLIPPSSLTVIDNLYTQDPNNPLSANMGYVLRELIENHTPQTTVTEVAHGFSPGDLVGFNVLGEWAIASSGADINLVPCEGYVKEVIDNDTFILAVSGVISTASMWTKGVSYYLDVAGLVTPAYPNNAQHLFTAISDSLIIFNPGDMFIEDVPTPSYFNYIFDNHDNGVAGYSLRRLSTGATNACRIRRSSDNAECDVALYASDSININSPITNLSGGTGTTITEWVGSNDAFVVTWYDQSLKGNDVTIATLAEQPRIILGGLMDTSNGLSTLEFLGGQQLIGPGTLDVFSGLKAFTTWSVASPKSIQGGGDKVTIFNTAASFSGSGLGIQHRMWHSAPTSAIFNLFSGSTLATAVDIGRSIGNGEQLLSRGTSNTQDFLLHINGSFEDSTPMVSLNINTAWKIGSNWGGASSGLIGTIQEVLVFAGDKTSEATNIEANINDHYNIY